MTHTYGLVNREGALVAQHIHLKVKTSSIQISSEIAQTLERVRPSEIEIERESLQFRQWSPHPQAQLPLRNRETG